MNSVNSGSLNRQTISEATRLATFGGGKGVRLGDFKITDSSGAKSAVSLDDDGAEAETIGDVIDRINALSIGVEARINDTGDGILITDIAGGEGTLTVAESGSGKTAADLRILAASDSTNLAGEQIIDGSISISIDLSQLEATSSVALSSLNNGNGISLGIFAITDNTGEGSFAVRLDEPGNEAFTIDDVITKINDAATAAGVQVSASLNKAGTGIQLTDTAGGSGELTVDDKGSGRSAEDLKLTGEVATNGGIQTIDGKGLFTAQDADQNTLDALAKKINDQGAGFSASTFFDGSGFRISITADSSGAAHELLVDAAGAGFSFEEIGRAQDAVLQVGGSTTTGLVITSSTNEFAGVTQGLDVTIQNVSDLPVTITVARDDTEFVDSVTDFVDSYNSLRSTLDELTSFNAETLTTGLLFGRSEVLRVERDLSRLLSGRFTSSTEFKSLEEIGVSLDDKGKLSRDKKELSAAYAANPQKLEQFFKADGTGVIDQFTTVVDRLAGEDNSLLSLRSDALTDTIDGNEQRVARYDEFLERERARTLLEFFRLEETISKLQVNLSVLDSLQSIAPLSFARKNN